MKVRLTNAGSIVRRPPDDQNARAQLEFGKVEEVDDSSYWRRRVRAGEVTEVKDDEPQAEVKSVQGGEALAPEAFRENGRETLPEVVTTKRNKTLVKE